MQPPCHDVVIVGTGFSGLCAAIRLRQAGVEDVVLLEKASALGGTWRDNTYPGCACDVQSHLYSFSFAPNPAWTRNFAGQPEILAYLESVTDRFGIRPLIRFDTEFQGAHWEDDHSRWRVHSARGVLHARALVMAVGPLHQPRIPSLPGAAVFDRPAFHSARWDHDVSLDGQRVGVVGTGASAIQIVPAIAEQVAQLHLFQRTPAWLLPRPDRDIGPAERAVYSALPALQWLRRTALYWGNELRTLGMTTDPRLMEVAARLARRHLRRQVADPDLRRRLTPDYTIGCKRVLLSDDFYPALCRDDVQLVDDAVVGLEPGVVRTAGGQRYPVDVLVYATGFHVVDALGALPLTGRQGLPLQDAWADGPEAYLGTTVHGFPNLFMLLGPNTGLGHTSMVFMIEAQVNLLVAAVQRLQQPGATEIEVKAAVQQAFNQQVQDQLDGTVWSSGCRSWYLDDDGQNRTLWPGPTWRFWQRTRQLDDRDWE